MNWFIMNVWMKSPTPKNGTFFYYYLYYTVAFDASITFSATAFGAAA